MQSLKEDGKYEVSNDIKEKISSVMWGGFADDCETKTTIRDIKEKYDYVIDTHTAVAVSVQEKYVKETGDETKTIIASTASPFKFSKSVMQAITNDECYGDGIDEFDILEKLSEVSGQDIPKSLADLKTKTILFNITCEKDEMQQMVKEFLRL